MCYFLLHGCNRSVTFSMTGRGRAGDGKSKRERKSPAQSSCSEGERKQSPPGAKAKCNSEQRSGNPRCASGKEKHTRPGAKAKGNSEQSASNPRCASGDVHIAHTKEKCSATSDESIPCRSISLKSTGAVKPKPKRETAETTSTPVGKDTANNKTSSSDSGKVGSHLRAPPPQKSIGTLNRKPKFDKKNSDSPSLDRHASHVEKKIVASPSKNDASDNEVLLSTLEKLKIKMTAKMDSSTIINEIVNTIIKHMKEKTSHFRAVEKMCTGSYYENVKISEPDEFDVMLALRVDRVALQKFDEEGAFYSVALKRTLRDDPLRDFLQEDNTITASKMLNKFREQVKLAVKSFPGVAVERKKAGCPAVTLLVKQGAMEIGLDIVLSLEVHSSWPECTKGGFEIDSWLGTKVKQSFKLRPFYLVSKYAGKGHEERDGVSARDVWRISFSHLEKDMLKNHGQAKTCCESAGIKCCRKACLKLLKYLLHQLKQKYPKQLSKFFSYLCKTTLLHACAARARDSDWDMGKLSDCFQQLLENFEGHLRQAELPNFFIPTHNLLGTFNRQNLEFLARSIESERNNGFPIFTE